MKGCKSKHAAIYGVRGMPVNFLIDGNGIIVATQLGDTALEVILEKRTK